MQQGEPLLFFQRFLDAREELTRLDGESFVLQNQVRANKFQHLTLYGPVTEGTVPSVDEAKFHELAQAAKTYCPVSKALAGTEVMLNAALVQSRYKKPRPSGWGFLLFISWAKRARPFEQRQTVLRGLPRSGR